MRNYLLVFLVFVLSSFNLLFAQDSICKCPQQCKTGKGTVYFSWGYNRDWFSKSDIHFYNHSNEYNQVTKQNDNYDFTMYDLEAKDKPGFKHLFTTQLTIPQYSFRLGYFFNNKKDLGLEINFDHTKYVVKDWQTIHLKGTIRGQSFDQDTLVSPDSFMHFQHTNGGNYLMLNFIKRQHLLISKNKKHWVSGIAKLGAGVVVPRSVVDLWGQRQDNFWHIAGYCIGLEAGLRYDGFKYVFVEYTAKETFAHYMDVLTVGSGKANHHFWTFENILQLGLQIPI